MAIHHDKASAKAELQRVYKLLGEPFSRKQYDEIGEIHSRTIEKLCGGWKKALVQSGLADRFLEHDRVEAEKKSFDADAAIDQDWEDKKQKLLAQAEERKVKWLREQLHKRDMLKEVLEETLAKAPPITVEIRPLKFKTTLDSAGHITIWFEFSDLQLGTKITSEEMGGLNKHNWIIWKEKLEIWKQAAILLIAQYIDAGYTIDHVVIAMIGDMVEGQQIFPGQVWQIEIPVAQQALFGANDTSGAFIEIFGAFPKLNFEVFEVFGNHGRVGKKGEDPFECSWDMIYQRFVELQVSRANLPNVTWHQNNAWFYLVEIYGWIHLLLHGDQGVGGLWSSRPTVNGLEKGIVRYNQMMQQQIHFMHAGHFHQDWGLGFNMSYMLINGSWIGTSKFSASKMVSGSPPMQTVHVFCPRVGLMRTERIHLTTGAVMKPLEPNRLEARK